jgi:hypothetical protein
VAYSVGQCDLPSLCHIDEDKEAARLRDLVCDLLEGDWESRPESGALKHVAETNIQILTLFSYRNLIGPSWSSGNYEGFGFQVRWFDSTQV